MMERVPLRRTLAIFAAEAVALALVGLLIPVRLARRLARRQRPRSLWTGAPIGVMALNARAERMLGARALSVVTHTYYITDAFDCNLSRLRNLPVVGSLLPFALFVWTCLFVDRVHFYCDRGNLPTPRRFGLNTPEFLAYRILGLEVFLWTYGADVRTRRATLALGEPNCCTDCPAVGHACVCDDAHQTRKMAWLSRRVTAVFSMGDMIEYAPGSRTDVHFWPVDLQADGGERYRPAYPRSSGDHPLRVVHAPNHQAFKGTRFLLAAIEELRAEEIAIELVLVQNVPNRQALELYRSADVIFDQCLIGFHGYFALEGMALGKPVMCFIRKPTSYLLAPDECPLVNTHVTTLREDLRRLAADRSRLEHIGRRGRDYIERHFSLEAVAKRLGDAYADLGARA
jgi:glycosyltransferase involved in cell wall biosynthesis